MEIPEVNPADSYSKSDRLLHKLAFSAKPAQIAVADIESQIFRKDIVGISVDRPVFVTSLARAGTTVLLEILSSLPDFAFHTYRNMPFTLCPLMWDRFSHIFRKDIGTRERAHGDGVIINADSPEAFEEIVWKTFWPKKYKTDHIDAWTVNDRSEEFEDFLKDHMRKIVALGRKRHASADRYLSKNNANIARLRLLPELFPDCRIVIPVRDPWAHAGSLLKQHELFLGMHAEDTFSRQYMSWLGHHEFGADLRPLDFGGWRDRHPNLKPTERAFWVAYWLAAYGEILQAAGPNVILIDYEALCCEPAGPLARLSQALGIRDSAILVAQKTRLRPSRPHDQALSEDETRLQPEVERLYHDLTAQCL